MGSSVSTRIDGETGKEISVAFAEYFSTVYGGINTGQHIALDREFHHRFAIFLVLGRDGGHSCKD